MARGQDSGKIRQYRKPLNINLGMVIFGAIFLYITICVCSYFFRGKDIRPYTVMTGSLSQNNMYTGIALRDEEIIQSNYSGYINYYAREGERVGSGQLVCAVDESGQLREILNEQDADNTTFSENDLLELKNMITSYNATFSKERFESVYDFKYDMEGTVLKLANVNMLDSLSALNDSSNSQAVALCYTPQSGIITYYVDGYESKTAQDITEEDFKQENYDRTQLISNELVTSQEPLYKLSKSEHWCIVIPVDRQTAQELEEEEFVKVRFMKNQYESWGEVTILDKGSEGVFAKLDFNNSMITFAKDRYIDIELLSENENGLKVPNSAIVNKEFFLIPKDYVTKGGNSGNTGVLVEKAGEGGTLTTEFVPTQIYQETEEDYYIDDASLSAGTHLIMPESTESYTVSRSAVLTGVYNINKGYADFKEIQILEQNEEYAIIKANTTYGLSAYDNIVLNAQSIESLNELIYE